MEYYEQLGFQAYLINKSEADSNILSSATAIAWRAGYHRAKHYQQEIAQLTARHRAARPIPAMRVVTKGWFTLREERVSVETLEQADRKRR